MRLINPGTSTNGPTTTANTSPEIIPDTAAANLKLLLAALNDKVTDLE